MQSQGVYVDTEEFQRLRDKKIIEGEESFIDDKENGKTFFVYNIMIDIESDKTIALNEQYNNRPVAVKPLLKAH